MGFQPLAETQTTRAPYAKKRESAGFVPQDLGFF